jgi:N-succinyldiaminopimelate aminotransferase
LIHAVRTVRQHLSFVSGGPFQLAIAQGLRFPETYFEGFRQDLSDKRDQLAAGLASAGFSVLPTEGTYFITTDISGLGFTDGLDFCRQLPELCRVVAIPHQVFYGDPSNGTNHVRWAFCKKPEVLAEATERLQVLLQR